MAGSPYIRLDYSRENKTFLLSEDMSGGGCCGENRREWRRVGQVDARRLIVALEKLVSGESTSETL